MSKAPEYRSSAVQWDGGLPFTVHSPEMSLSAAASNQGQMVAPCDGTIVALIANLTEAPDTAAAALQVGNETSATAYGSHSFATTASTGVIDITGSLTSTAVSQGDVIEFNTDGVALSTGKVAVTMVVSPN